MKPQFLYVIAPEASDYGPCKLGISTNPARRVKQLQTGHSETLAVRYSEEVDPDKVYLFEKLLHRDINYLRQRGEWFKLSVEDAISHVQFTIIQYGSVVDLSEKVRQRRI